MKTRFMFTLLIGIGALTCNSIAAAKACDSQCLHSLSSAYLDALIKHDAQSLPLAKSLKITENGQSIQLNEGLWKNTTQLRSYRESFEDARTGNAFVIVVAEENGAPAIVATRLHAPQGTIDEIETIAARKGSHPLFTPDLLKSADPLFSQPIKKQDRSSRARMIAIANTYFDGIEKNSSKNILATEECDRFENGTKTTHRNASNGGCAQSADAINYIKAVRDRRFFIVNEVTGVAVCTIVFDIPGNDSVTPQQSGDGQLAKTLRKSRMLLLTEVFKIEAGKIQRIQAVMHNLPHGANSGWEQ